ncbi:MAG: DUF934 domain-containing protein [Alphaproteobacteria bacterium]|nr:DUF934 domain-containing protein [Alphaproteobacteria bacterium]
MVTVHSGSRAVPSALSPLPLDAWLLDLTAAAVSLPNTASPDLLGDGLARLELIALHFPKFNDGRAYSQARLLRGRMGYRGELRATGDVLRDQLPFMLRCGFDSFEKADPPFGEAVRAAATLFSVVYQPAEDNRVPAAELRRLATAGAMAAAAAVSLG